MLSALILSPALLAQPDACGTADAIAALQGRSLPRHAGMLAAPPRVGGPRVAPPPGGGKSVYGGNYTYHLETENFTLNWEDATIPAADAELAAEALEQAWTAFLDEQGWTAPTSSDRFYLWVLLERGQPYTGYTTEYFTTEYPDGYPVIFLNPDANKYGDAYWKSLAAHEFMHAVQFAMREWGSEPEQTWYWEASATYGSELADPTWDGHQYISAWYAEQTSEAYDSYQGSHQYGMFVLNAWLDEVAYGPGTMLEIWQEGGDRPGDTWDALIADVTGSPAAEVWAGFSGQYGNNELPESGLFTDVISRGTLADGASGSPGYLGSDYWTVGEDCTVSVDGDAILGGAGGVVGATIGAEAGTLISVTATAAGASYTLTVGPPAEDPDTGSPDTGTGSGGEKTEAEAGQQGCATVSAPVSAMVWLAGLAALWWRRR